MPPTGSGEIMSLVFVSKKLMKQLSVQAKKRGIYVLMNNGRTGSYLEYRSATTGQYLLSYFPREQKFVTCREERGTASPLATVGIAVKVADRLATLLNA